MIRTRAGKIHYGEYLLVLAVVTGGILLAMNRFRQEAQLEEKYRALRAERGEGPDLAFPPSARLTLVDGLLATLAVGLLLLLLLRHHARLHQSHRVQEVLNQLLRLSPEPIPLEQQLSRGLEEIASIPWLDLEPRGAIFLVDEGRRELVLKASYHFDPRLLGHCARVPLGRCLCGRVAERGRPRFWPDVDGDHEVTFEGMPPHGHYIVPILSVRGDPIGVLNLYVRPGKRERREITAFLTTCCQLLARMIERRRYEEESCRSHAALEQLARRLQDHQIQLVQSEKLAAIGQLAAGVAHEINNPLGFIVSNVGTLGEYLQVYRELLAASEEARAGITDRAREAMPAGGDAGSPPAPGAAERRIREIRERKKFGFIEGDLPHLLAETSEGLRQVRKIVEGLKNFTRVDEAETKAADLNEGLETVLQLLQNELRHKCRVTRCLAPLPLISCVPGQLNQVFMNLLVNAIQAVPEQGEITVASRVDGGEIEIRISDTGSGISPEHLGRLFTPFFTTKPRGKGTGLGLSISYDIVRRHGGTITVASEVGKGTTFAVRIPLAPPDPISAAPAAGG